MTTAMPNGKGPMLMIGAVVVGAALWMMSRNSQAKTIKANLASRRPIANPGRVDRSQTYANPQAMAELLARSVVQITNGIKGTLPKVVTDVVGTPEAQAAIIGSDDPGFYGWTGPVVSSVDPGIAAIYTGDPYHGGDLVDGIPAAPVYDITTDIELNPWMFDGGGGD